MERRSDYILQYNEHKDKEEHKGHLSYDLIAGAAAYEAAKAFENHQATNGKPQSHAEAKAIAYVVTPPIAFVAGCRHEKLTRTSQRAGAISAFLTHEVSTKGLDWWDESQKEKVQHQAQKQAEAKLKEVENYGDD